MTDGGVLFARYAFPPNELGYCGPADSGGLLRHAASAATLGATDPAMPSEEVERKARKFEGAWVYLELDRGRRGVADPMDLRVVEAYWIGNELLDALDPAALTAELGRASRDSWSVRRPAVGSGCHPGTPPPSMASTCSPSTRGWPPARPDSPALAVLEAAASAGAPWLASTGPSRRPLAPAELGRHAPRPGRRARGVRALAGGRRGPCRCPRARGGRRRPLGLGVRAADAGAGGTARRADRPTSSRPSAQTASSGYRLALPAASTGSVSLADRRSAMTRTSYVQLVLLRSARRDEYTYGTTRFPKGAALVAPQLSQGRGDSVGEICRYTADGNLEPRHRSGRPLRRGDGVTVRGAGRAKSLAARPHSRWTRGRSLLLHRPTAMASIVVRTVVTPSRDQAAGGAAA